MPSDDIQLVVSIIVIIRMFPCATKGHMIEIIASGIVEKY